MNRVEITPEQPIQTPTETSKGFLKRWGDEVLVGLNVTNLGLQAFFGGLNLAQGDNEIALFHGIMAGCWGAVTILKGVSMSSEKRALKDKVVDLESKR